MGALIGYARVSTRAQNEEPQLDMLREAGCEKIFVDKASGKLARRPDWDRCQEYLRPGDTLVITRFSRVARNLRNLLNLSHWLEERGVHLRVLTLQIDTATAAGKLLFQIMGAVDEFQAELIRENTMEGLAAARARGRRGGRPRAMRPDQLERALALRDEGRLSMVDIARVVGCSRTTLYRELERAVSPSAQPPAATP